MKPAAPAVMATGLYAGTTLADDGSPILLFDPAGLAEVGGVKLEAQERAARIAEGSGRGGIEGDSGPAVPRARRRRAARSASRSSTGSRKCRAMRSSEAAGQLRVQLGEAILPLAGAAAASSATARCGCSASTTARTRSAMPSPKSSISRRSTHDVIHAERPGEVSGVSLINGEPAELVDAHWLFANHVGAAARATEAAGLPAAERRSVDAEHAAPDRRGRGLSRRRRRAMKAMPISSSPRRATKSPTPQPARRSGCAPNPSGRQEGRQHLSLRPRGPADGPEVRRSGEGQMNELLLVVTIAGERVALPAAAVESVVELDTLIPVPRAAPHVAGLSALRSRVLTVIDCMRSLELGDHRLLRRNPRGRRRRVRRPSLCAHRRPGRGRGRSAVRSASRCAPRWGRGGSASRKEWSIPRPEPLLLVDVAALIAGAPKPRQLKLFVTLSV